ncbi:hypothetical protein [Martelella alba]|uniref:Uncharacterized protein n=1 Tax=Martelella alba TaxID=2590451 RepID=A0ABY2SDR9_9HYPH|nr:hypothetical protein [Martelella alba]TKI02298.1 hypothetical protein FCN80_25425 [Martelella alba]
MKANKLPLIITLIYRCVFVFIFLCMTGTILASVLVFFKLGYFTFDWKEALPISIKKGTVAGLVLAVGIWIKVKLAAKKLSKPPE